MLGLAVLVSFTIAHADEDDWRTVDAERQEVDMGDIILRIAEYKPSRDRKYENPTHVRLPRPQYEDSGQTCTGYSRHPRPTDIANLSPLVRLRTLQIRREE